MTRDEFIRDMAIDSHDKCVAFAIKLHNTLLDAAGNGEYECEPFELSFSYILTGILMIKSQMCHPSATTYDYKPEDLKVLAYRCFDSAFASSENIDVQDTRNVN